MTWWFDPETGSVYNHEGTEVASGLEFTWREDIDGQVIDPPSKVYDEMRKNMDGDQPSAYNQTLLADAATDNIKKGTPP